MEVQIKEWTGPLDLLLQLIRKEEMDILDIDIHKITHQYLMFIETQTLPNLDSAGDFIKLAATLIYIKSKSLLPDNPSIELDEESSPQIDPKEELVKNLLRVQKLQKMAKQLYQYPLLGRDVWSKQSIPLMSNVLLQSRPNQSQDSALKNSEKSLLPQKIPLLEKLPTSNKLPFSILNLLKAYQKTHSTNQPTLLQPSSTPSISDRIRSICLLLTDKNQWKMNQLISPQHKKSFSQTLVVFLSLLELARLGLISLHQERYFSDITIFVIKDIKEWKWKTENLLPASV